MKTKLKLCDFTLDPIFKISITGGDESDKNTTYVNSCTSGDVGCCDNPVVNDVLIDMPK